MTAPVATKVWLNDIPVQYIRPFEIRLSRGWEPWTFAIGVTDDRFDALKNPITIKIQTVGDDEEPVTLELEDWNIATKVVHNEYSYDLIIQDPRWVAESGTLSASYNVKWWGVDQPDEMRQGASNNGSRWTVVDAIRDALEKFGLTVDPNPQLDSDIATQILPLNLGPSPGGGFGGVKYLEAMPILAESAQLDIVCKPNGHVMIVDRITDLTDQFIGFRAIKGRVEEKDMHWSQPKRLEILFPKRIEQRFEYLEVTRGVTLPSGRENYQGTGMDNEIRNVIPTYDPDFFTNTHSDLYPHVFSEIGQPRLTVLQRILLPGIFQWGDARFMKTLTAKKYAQFKFFEVQLQECWRRRFRVEKQALSIGEVARPLADLKFGKLSKDGTTSGVGGVYMNYVKINRYSHYQPGKGPDAAGGSMFDAIFSDNFLFSGLDAAPFDAQWMTDGVDELIFEVAPRPASKLARNYIPGELLTPMEYGDINDIAAGGQIEALEGSLILTDNFQMQVYYHGLQIADVASGLENTRMHRIVEEIFPNGEGPTLQIKASNITANYAFNEAHPLPLEEDIINQTELNEAALYIKSEIKRSYSSTKHGGLDFASVKPIVEGVQTNGNIYDTVIQIGFDQEFTCSVSYMVMPSITQAIQPREKRSGVPARITDGG